VESNGRLRSSPYAKKYDSAQNTGEPASERRSPNVTLVGDASSALKGRMQEKSEQRDVCGWLVTECSQRQVDVNRGDPVRGRETLEDRTYVVARKCPIRTWSKGEEGRWIRE